MKKIGILILILFAISLLPFGAFAAEGAPPELLDSRDVSETGLKMMHVLLTQETGDGQSQLVHNEEVKAVLRCYYLSFSKAFGNSTTMEKVMSSANAPSIHYAVLSTDGTYTVYDENFHRVYPFYSDTPVAPALTEFLENGGIKAISPDIAIHKMYYLIGDRLTEGQGIYYETNLGTYVYYCEGGEYLLPIADFCRLQADITARSALTGNADGNDILPSDVWNMSQYDFRSPLFAFRQEAPAPSVPSSGTTAPSAPADPTYPPTVPVPSAPRDSSDIDPSILAEIYAPASSEVVYVYGRWIADAFGSQDYTGIESVLSLTHGVGQDNVVVLSGESDLWAYAVIQSSGEIHYAVKTHDTRFDPDIFKEYRNPSAIYRVADDIQIRARYVICDEFNHDSYGSVSAGDTGSMIFYETDRGNYLYLMIGNQEFLMPEAGIRPFAKSYFQWKQQVYEAGKSNPGINADTYALLYQYNLNSEDFSLTPESSTPWGWILAGGTLLIVVSTAVILLVKRRRSPA